MMNLLNRRSPFFLLGLLLALALVAGCDQASEATVSSPQPTVNMLPTESIAEVTEVEATAEAATAGATREGSRVMLPYRAEGAGITLFRPPSWTTELDPASGLLLVAPEVAANFRDISNALIVATPISTVGQTLVPGEEQLTEARAEAALQFLVVNFAAEFVPDITIGEEITIVEEGQRARVTVPYSGTTVQDIPVSGTLNLIIEGEQVAAALTLMTAESIADLLAEMVGSISLSEPR